MSQENNASDEVNLLYYLKVILNKKRLLLGVFFSTVAGAIILNIALPKIYQGEFFVKVKIYDYADVYRTIKIDSYGLRKNIFKQTLNLIKDVRLSVFSDTVDCKIHLIVEAKDTSDIRKIADEFTTYIKNTPYQKEYIAQQEVLLQNEINEYTASVEYIDKLLKSYLDKTNPEFLGIKQLLDQKTEWESKRLSAEQSLKNLSGAEIIFSEVYSLPVRPAVISNIILAAIAGFLAGILAIILSELNNKIRSAEK